MDQLDKRLLNFLEADARAPVSGIARKLGISRSTVQSRVERLERKGIIRGYTVLLASEYEKSLVKAHVLITVAPKVMPGVTGALEHIPEVKSLHSVSGSHDLIAIVATETTGDMDRVIDLIGQIEGIDRTTTSIVLSTKFDR